MNVVGIDVGGANLKAADGQHVAISRPFALWKTPSELPTALKDLVAEVQCNAGRAAEPTTFLATMTGELADCYATKREGVASIVAALQQVAGSNPLGIYLTDGRMVPARDACAVHQLAAASNWHVMASYIAENISELSTRAVMLDVGSTTCDLIPIVQHRVASHGLTDLKRLAAGELLYMGVERTPLSALMSALPYRDILCPVAREVFAGTGDAYVVLGDMPENPENRATADGRPATREFAVARLARCLCADADDFSWEDAVAVANAVAKQQAALLARAILRVVRERCAPTGVGIAPSVSSEAKPVDGMTSGLLDTPELIVVGHGDFLVQRAMAMVTPAMRPRIRYCSSELGIDVSRVGPAYALAAMFGARATWQSQLAEPRFACTESEDQQAT